MDIYEQLRRDEGEILYAYKDSRGFLTIGNGRLIDRRGGGITPTECVYLLNNDVAKKTKDLDEHLSWWRQLDPVRQAAVLNMAFQLGIEGLLEFQRSLALIKREDWEGASHALLQSDWASQTPVRAHRVAEQIRTGNWQ